MDTPEPVIVIADLVKDYGNSRALDHVSLDVLKGETLALIGSSGSGKTTLLKSINGLIPVDSGRIDVYGQSLDAWDLVELRRRIGYVIQEVGLFPHYTIERNIRLVPELLNWDAARIEDRIDELLERIHIPAEMKKRYPDALSGGQQQRIGLARALAADPQIILMDEPFGALDPIIRENMQQEFLTMESLSDKTVLLVTHDMGEAAILADRICLLDQGRVQQTGSLRDLLFDPANDFVRRFLDPHRDELEMRAVTIRDMDFCIPEEHLSEFDDWNIALADVGSVKSALIRKLYYLNREELMDKLKRA
ncbi:MAG: ATP-binding cassette domain-containing protein [Cyclobacteriaceae bacterium]